MFIEWSSAIILIKLIALGQRCCGEARYIWRFWCFLGVCGVQPYGPHHPGHLVSLWPESNHSQIHREETAFLPLHHYCESLSICSSLSFERFNDLYIDSVCRQICAIIGGTFTVAGIIDSCIFTASEAWKKIQIGKMSWAVLTSISHVFYLSQPNVCSHPPTLATTGRLYLHFSFRFRLLFISQRYSQQQGFLFFFFLVGVFLVSLPYWIHKRSRVLMELCGKNLFLQGFLIHRRECVVLYKRHSVTLICSND